MDRSIRSSALHQLIVIAGIGVAGVSMAPVQAQQLCGGLTYPFPYTDVSGIGAAFCPGIMEAYVTGVSKGTTPTTFSPNNTVTRVQMTTFLQRSLDQGLARTSRRAALEQWWTSQTTSSMQMIAIPGATWCAADGEDIWVTTGVSAVQVHANSGAILGTWTGIANGYGAVIAAGKVFVTGHAAPGSLYLVDPTQPPGTAVVVASNLGNTSGAIAFDGTRLWTADQGGSVSIITPQATTPYPVATVTTGFTQPAGILYDGAHIWVTDFMAAKLFKLDATGVILQTVAVGAGAGFPVFDGANIWVPNASDNSITVVQASTGNVVATITTDANNHLDTPLSASFDGERVLVTNNLGATVTVFEASDLSFITNVPTPPSSFPYRACSDGINFWVPLSGASTLLRF